MWVQLGRPGIALLGLLFYFPAALAQFLQLYSSAARAPTSAVTADAVSAPELAGLLQRLLREAAQMRKRSSGGVAPMDDVAPPGFVGARGRRQNNLQELPPGFVGARGKRMPFFRSLEPLEGSLLDRQLAPQ